VAFTAFSGFAHFYVYRLAFFKKGRKYIFIGEYE
jgi:hypothetical protein